MSLLKQVIKGKIESPFLVLVFGNAGVGKSTFGASAPNPIFVGPEQGTNNLDISRFPTPKNFGDVTQALNELATEPHDFKTVVIDSLDWLELLAHQKIMADYRVKSIELAAGGYGKGYTEARNLFSGLIEQLNTLRNKRGMNIVLIAHSQIIKFEDPQSQTAYDRFTIKLHKASSALFQEYVDAILFCTYKKYTAKDGENVRTFSDGARVMFTSWAAGHDAKNRYGLPEELPLSWSAFIDAVKSDVMTRITALMEQVPIEKHDAINAAVVRASGNKAELETIETRIKLSTKKGESNG
jgi:hypothetical protein